MKTFDFVIVGAGILGLSFAREVSSRFPGSSVAVLEKEHKVGLHGSGRNSGVLHSGIYYPEGSLKARLCSQGAGMLYNYCRELDLPVSQVGKVILPVREDDDQTLDLLMKRAASNGVKAQLIDSRDLAEIEPLAHTSTGRAIHVPGCAVVDSRSILEKMLQQIGEKNGSVFFGERFVSVDLKKSMIRCGSGQSIGFGHLINVAGLFADKVAHAFDIGRQYSMMPFKGLYYDLADSKKSLIRGLIYPVPDLRLPFLGVHFTKGVQGQVYIGPNALPALGRENYTGTTRAQPIESVLNLGRNFKQYVKDEQGFRRLMHEEVMRFSKHYFVKAAQTLVPSIGADSLKRSEKVGIRAQLYDRSKKQLVLDFLLEKGPRSTHILNAVSPGFTCGPSFARYVVQEMMTI